MKRKTRTLAFDPAMFFTDPVLASMTAAEVGAYVLLLARACLSEKFGTLTDFQDELQLKLQLYLQRITRLPSPAWKRSQQIILSQWVAEDGLLKSKYLLRLESAATQNSPPPPSPSLSPSSPSPFVSPIPIIPSPIPNRPPVVMKRMREGCGEGEGVPPEKKPEKVKSEVKTPPELVGLELYEADQKLCARWPALIKAWKIAYPGVDILAEVRKAHAWEVANPDKRKVQKARFLAGWLGRQQDRWRPGVTNRYDDSDPDGWIEAHNAVMRRKEAAGELPYAGQS